jgi:hypothetical protein
MNPISVEVIVPVLTNLRHCELCEFIFGQTEGGSGCMGKNWTSTPRTCLNDTCFGLFDQMEPDGVSLT